MSFLRRLSNPFHTPQPSRIEDLPTHLKDNIFVFQLSSQDFQRITAETFLIAKLTNSATKLLQSCSKSGIIDPETGHVNTYKISGEMVSHMPNGFGIEQQRRLVMLLFFWEEECIRQRLLRDEEDEIKLKLTESGLSRVYKRQLRTMLEVVQARMRVLPSCRDESGRILGSGNDEERLPSYDEANGRR